MYKEKEGSFGRSYAMQLCVKNDEFDLVEWWSNFGNHSSNLQRMAMGILALTTSSSGSERNWSSFEGLHTKKKNRLDTTRLNNLVCPIQLKDTQQKEKKMKDDKTRDSLLANETSMAQGWIADGGEDDDDEVEPMNEALAASGFSNLGGVLEMK